MPVASAATTAPPGASSQTQASSPSESSQKPSSQPEGAAGAGALRGGRLRGGAGRWPARTRDAIGASTAGETMPRIISGMYRCRRCGGERRRDPGEPVEGQVRAPGREEEEVGPARFACRHGPSRASRGAGVCHRSPRAGEARVEWRPWRGGGRSRWSRGSRCWRGAASRRCAGCGSGWSATPRPWIAGCATPPTSSRRRPASGWPPCSAPSTASGATCSTWRPWGTDRDRGTGLPVHSLYGSAPESLRPRRSQLEGLDALVFDVQDIGTRYYTYQATMMLCMEAAAEAGPALRGARPPRSHRRTRRWRGRPCAPGSRASAGCTISPSPRNDGG